MTIRSHVTVPGLTATEVTDFLSDCTDEGYQKWWPGVHLHLHPLNSGNAAHVGDAVFMDEFIGERRLRMTAVVIEADRGRKLVWQMKKAIRLPAWLTIEVTDRADGVDVCHTITAGWTGPGRLLDPLLKLYFSPAFATAMDKHVHTEFPLIRERLHPAAQ
nr:MULTISPECIES: SRPBCC family protein [unclassified Mycolicibacterium]